MQKAYKLKIDSYQKDLKKMARSHKKELNKVNKELEKVSR